MLCTSNPDIERLEADKSVTQTPSGMNTNRNPRAGVRYCENNRSAQEQSYSTEKDKEIMEKPIL